MPNAKYYAKLKEKWLKEPELYNKEKERINTFIKNKYATNEEFRNKCIEYQRSRNKK
jgi:hypothetical protein